MIVEATVAHANAYCRLSPPLIACPPVSVLWFRPHRLTPPPPLTHPSPVRAQFEHDLVLENCSQTILNLSSDDDVCAWLVENKAVRALNAIGTAARASVPALRNTAISLARLAMHGDIDAMADEGAKVSGKALLRPTLDTLERLFAQQDPLINKMVATVLANWARLPLLAESVLPRAVRMLVPLSNTYDEDVQVRPLLAVY